MLRLANPVHIAKLFDANGAEVPEHSCQFEMQVLEDKFIANRDEIAITAKEAHLGFTLKIFDDTSTVVWHKHYPLLLQANQTLRLPKHELKIPLSVGAPVRGVG